MSAAEIREETSSVDDNVKNRIEINLHNNTHLNSEGVNEILMYYSQGLHLITKLGQRL